MKRDWVGWLLTAMVVAVVAWMLLAPGKLEPPLGPEDVAGCYAGGGARIVIRPDQTMRAGDIETRYHIYPGVRGSRSDAVVPDKVRASGDAAGLRFEEVDITSRWWVSRGKGLQVNGVMMRRVPCEGATR
ncbi:MAG: hypothetical protein KF730_10800 [Sphingomonas sp.]|uniref:hypothetical protein n=1 Tax=Sphingomonas sp. TaxID=28214 RepID=UPI0025E004F6|nr:hypothetical protein [Sphingomonas sp.]MBX3565051.1 hypothetical protein [Sphingomonas sp.]